MNIKEIREVFRENYIELDMSKRKILTTEFELLKYGYSDMYVCDVESDIIGDYCLKYQCRSNNTGGSPKFVMVYMGYREHEFRNTIYLDYTDKNNNVYTYTVRMKKNQNVSDSVIRDKFKKVFELIIEHAFMEKAMSNFETDFCLIKDIEIEKRWN